MSTNFEQTPPTGTPLPIWRPKLKFKKRSRPKDNMHSQSRSTNKNKGKNKGKNTTSLPTNTEKVTPPKLDEKPYVLFAQANLHNMPQATAEFVQYINSSMRYYRYDEINDTIRNTKKPNKKRKSFSNSNSNADINIDGAMELPISESLGLNFSLFQKSAPTCHTPTKGLTKSVRWWDEPTQYTSSTLWGIRNFSKPTQALIDTLSTFPDIYTGNKPRDIKQPLIWNPSLNLDGNPDSDSSYDFQFTYGKLDYIPQLDTSNSSISSTPSLNLTNPESIAQSSPPQGKSPPPPSPPPTGEPPPLSPPMSYGSKGLRQWIGDSQILPSTSDSNTETASETGEPPP